MSRHPLTQTSEPITVVAAGKAAWPMVQGAAGALGSRLQGGVATGIRGSGALPAPVRWFDGGHPLPNAASVDAGHAALTLAADVRRHQGLLLVLLSGGASAMLCAPAEGITLAEKVAMTERLMRCGRPIWELNCVRRHLSRIKGGYLGVAAGRCLTLAISDVHFPHDSPCDIGSGLTVPDPTTFADALAMLNVCEGVPEEIRSYLERAAADGRSDTPKPGDGRLAHSVWEVIANRETAMRGAEQAARRLGYHVDLVRTHTSGEARDAGRNFVGLPMLRRPSARASCVIGAGETTVTVRGDGKGGRNQEFVLGAAEFLAGEPDVLLASIGTDGIDGPTDAAGGIVTGVSYFRARALGLPIEDALARNDAYTLLSALDDLIEWGPTLTNVGDLHVLLTMNG